jgi:4-diphosphocytidyl-2-C-methyl-D-erythritol kinase
MDKQQQTPRAAVMQFLRLLAPAKINLHLRVAPPGADGFHPLLTWMCTVSFFDSLIISPSEDVSSSPGTPGEGRGGGLPIDLSCDPSLPCDQTNLVVRGAKLLADYLNAYSTREGGDAPVGSPTRGTEGTTATVAERALARYRAVLQKRIPTGAGLGGGSSDGARIMQALNCLWAANLPPPQLAALSATIGSDLPFFFFGASSLCRGRGEIVQPIPSPRRARWAVLVLPKIAMPTPAVYQKFDQMKLGDPRSVDELSIDPSAWADLPALELLPRLVNDLEAPAFALRPDLGKLRHEIEVRLNRPVRMSGSGSSLFSLFDEKSDAERAAQHLDADDGSATALAVELAPVIDDDLKENLNP